MRARLDPLALFSNDLFLDSNLIDIAPAIIRPTWRNGRSMDGGLAKILYRFLMSEHMAQFVDTFCSCILPSSILDHFPIFLQIDVGAIKLGYQFKFNHSWLAEDDFNTFVTDC